MYRWLPRGLRARLERRGVRLLTYLAARAPSAWRWGIPSRLMRGTFDPMATSWDRTVGRHGPGWAAPLEAGLARLPRDPRRALDLGTGTGLGASLIARRYPDAEVTGVDVSPEMVRRAGEAHAGVPNVSFTVADGHGLPFGDGEVDLVTHVNARVFFAELARVTAPGRPGLICFSLGERTPVYLPTWEVERRLTRHGFGEIESGTAGQGVWTLGVRG